jgi:peptide deformylase
MKELDILLYPDTRLRQVCKPVSVMSDRLDKIIGEMLYTMYQAPGIGLAASQIGVMKRLFVADVSENNDEPVVLINPEIIKSSGEMTYEEGCLSLPGVYADIVRPANILVKAMNRDGKMIEMEANDLLAICIQHEIDHLNGKMFVDHLSSLKRNRILKKYKKDMLEKELDQK